MNRLNSVIYVRVSYFIRVREQLYKWSSGIEFRAYFSQFMIKIKINF
jgi:hypothetical protein